MTTVENSVGAGARGAEETAEHWIGPSTEKDELRPKAIAQTLPVYAAALKDVLLNSEVAGREEIRQRFSRESASAQNWLLRLAASVVVGSGIAALASGLLLYGQGSAGAPAADVNNSLLRLIRDNQALITVVQVIGLFAATTAGAVLAVRDFGQIWTEKRRAAEALRVEIVEWAMKLAAASPGAPGPTSLLRQFLEFFRRYQLDRQRRYYKDRGKAHEVSDTSLIWGIAALSGVAAISGVLGGLGTVHPALPVLAAFLGIAVPILLSAAQRWRTVSRAAEKAAAYQAAGEALDRQFLNMSAVRQAADKGDIEAVRKFVGDIHSIMRAESGAFKASGDVGKPTVSNP